MPLPLNPDQQIARDAVHGNTVVVAGPGSGKTATMLERYIHMRMLGIPETDILNLTFTHSAATEMVERVGLMNADKVFKTFHSFALDLLKRERQSIPFPTTDTIIPVYGQDFQLIKDLLKSYPAIRSFRTLREKLSEWKASNVSPEEAIQHEYNNGVMFFYAHAYRDYERICREQGWLDFDSLMKETVKLLETNDEVRKRNQKKFICVDECQDTDVVQFRLLQLLYNGNIFVVGDENQLIYEWRSAVAGSLSNFHTYFPGAKTLYLGQNYRSTQKLVEFFKKILPVDNGIASHLVSMRDEGVAPTITEFTDDFEEANVVLSRITDIKNSAVIARTNRQLLTFQKRCMAANIKSKIVGRKDLWQQTEIKHLLELAKKNKLDSRPAAQVLSELIVNNGLMETYRGSGNPNESDPVENLTDIVKMAKNKGSIADFLDHMRKLTYARASEKNPILSLTTVHQAKGREWKHVFVIGARQGLMPHQDGEFLEEKRIFYVACTRAADTLEISYYGPRSEFLNEFAEDVEVYGDEDGISVY